MHRPRRPGMAALLGLGLLISAGPADAADRAISLDGELISVERAAEIACHDLDPEAIRCFETTAEMEADLRTILRGGDGMAAAVLASGYVIVYEDNYFDGASRTLSIDYANLSSIGWNDRISSFKSFGASGHFREHANPPSGFTYGYGSSTQVSSLGSTHNDKFSYFLIN